MGSSGTTKKSPMVDVLADYLNRQPKESDYALIGHIALQQTGLGHRLVMSQPNPD